MNCRVGVLRGGPSSEYEISLKTGDAVLRNLPKHKYKVSDILITKNGEWNIDGFPTTPAKLARQIDVAFNAMHGEFGEDGQVQQVLEHHKIPFTGARAFASSLGMNKGLAKQAFENHGIRTPKYYVVKQGDDILQSAMDIFHGMESPFVVKPISAGSSVGVVQVSGYKELISAIQMILNKYPAAIVEQFVRGREITCGVIDIPEWNETLPLKPIEVIVPSGEMIWDYNAKYSGKTEEICPAEIDDNMTARIQALAVAAHDALGMHHYSRSDFIVNAYGIWILEINSLPGLTEESLLPKSLAASGIGLPYFLDYVVTLALTEK